ncbi:hypothetical protein EVAR_22671_1 [Eumeta japonica]|uniref:Uncharacterized protein n=1 Tax=Eumeta variegata TaxID=151549 RepID=A0A4C1VMY7_EUMVA|nr:hypothetical protein EVAR_22671_1 [Eumeta japonica]
MLTSFLLLFQRYEGRKDRQTDARWYGVGSVIGSRWHPLARSGLKRILRKGTNSEIGAGTCHCTAVHLNAKPGGGDESRTEILKRDHLTGYNKRGEEYRYGLVTVCVRWGVCPACRMSLYYCVSPARSRFAPASPQMPPAVISLFCSRRVSVTRRRGD